MLLTARNEGAAPKQGAGPLKVAAYIRVSTTFASQDGSYHNQKSYFERAISQNPDWEMAGIYADLGVTGTQSEGREGYNRLLRHCLEGRIDRVLCKSISRFSRNTGDFLAAVRQLEERGVSVYFEKEGLDTASMASAFVLTALAAIAQEEARTISENVRWGIEKRYRKGEGQNFALYGYRFADGEDKFEVFEDGYKVRRLVIDKKESEVVRRIFELIKNGAGFAMTARILNAEKILPPEYSKADKWTAEHISRIVKSERYCGEVYLQKSYTADFLTHKTKPNHGQRPLYKVKKHHPPIIDKELFLAVREITEHNSHKYANKSGIRNSYAFCGKIVSADGKTRYNARRVSGRIRWYLRNSGGRAVDDEQAFAAFFAAFKERYLKSASLNLKGIAAELADYRLVDENEQLILNLDVKREKIEGQIDFINKENKENKERLNQLLKEKEFTAKRLAAAVEYKNLAAKNRKYREQTAHLLGCAEMDNISEFLNLNRAELVRGMVLTLTVCENESYCLRWFDDRLSEVELQGVQL